MRLVEVRRVRFNNRKACIKLIEVRRVRFDYRHSLLQTEMEDIHDLEKVFDNIEYSVLLDHLYQSGVCTNVAISYKLVLELNSQSSSWWTWWSVVRPFWDPERGLTRICIISHFVFGDHKPTSETTWATEPRGKYWWCVCWIDGSCWWYQKCNKHTYCPGSPVWDCQPLYTDQNCLIINVAKCKLLTTDWAMDETVCVQGQTVEACKCYKGYG